MQRETTITAADIGVLVLVGLLALSACGVGGGALSQPNGTAANSSPTVFPHASATASPSVTPAPGAVAALACRIQVRTLQPPPPVRVTVTCMVNDAPNGQTTFVLSYRLGGSNAGQTGISCNGTLRNGAGSCSMAFNEDAVSENPGTVQGELLPGHLPLGPVVPQRDS